MGKLLGIKDFKGGFTIKADTLAGTVIFPAEKITERLQEVLYCGNSEVDQILSYLLENSGKMLRPRMVYLSGSLYPHDDDSLTDIAAALELIHMASLVHDDIIDNSQLRRGQPSINQRWGNQVGVLTGDFLFASAFNLISRCQQPRIMENVTDTIKIMCSGEIKQMGMLFDLNLSEADYYDKTYRKTACLFASSCKAGAMLSQAPEQEIMMLEQFGLNLGYAYQIIDDVLDFVSDSSLLGKPAASDLRQGNITLPVILALKDSKYGKKLRSLLQSNSGSPRKLKEIQTILEATGALQESVRLSRRYLELGLNLLEEFPLNPVIGEMKRLSRYLLEGYYKKLDTSVGQPLLMVSAEEDLFAKSPLDEKITADYRDYN
jgi:heptaprenyl diphosphate synthase